MKLTAANVRALRIKPGKSERIEFDERLPGFGVRLRSGGKAKWIVQYRAGSQQSRMTLGSLDKIDASRAFTEAKTILARVQLGADPQKEKDEKRKAKTLRAMIEGWKQGDDEEDGYLKYAEQRLKPRSYEEVKRHIEKQWSNLHRKQLREITRSDVTARLTQIKNKSGPIAANRARSSLSTLFAWAIGQGYADLNPVIGTNKPTDERSRDRVLTNDELVNTWKACEDDDYGHIVRLLILTGQRRDEVGGISEFEIDLDDRLWSIPRLRTKNKRDHDVPLSDAAIEILRKVEAGVKKPDKTVKKLDASGTGRDGRPFLFGRGEKRSFSGWSGAKRALDARISEATKQAVEPWRLHDIRRTVCTMMADELDIQPHVIEAITNHISGHRGGVAGVYNRATYAVEKRQALDRWAAHVVGLVSGKPVNVVPMRA